MKNGFTITQRNAVVEQHLWCIDTVMAQYESVHADENYGLGSGWTSNFSYALEFDGRSVIAHLPRAVTLYFPIGFDGSFDACGDYSLVQTGSGYAMTDKAGTIYRFDNSGRILSIVYLSGNTLSFQYDGDKLRSVSNGAGSFTFSYSGDNIAAVTDSVGRSIHLSYDGGLLTEVENPDGDSLRYAYDGNGYLSSVQNLKGEIYVENEYDAQGRVSPDTEPVQSGFPSHSADFPP